MKTNNGFVVPILLGIIILLLVGGGVYIYKNQKAEAPDVVDAGTQNNVITETEILASLKTNWQIIQTSISFRPTHPGTTAWLSPYSVQFIGNNNLFVSFEDGYSVGMAVLNFTNGQFKILETFKNQGEFPLVDWQNLVKKYGDASYSISTYTVSLMRNNEIVSFQELTKVPENVFVKDYFVTPPTKNTYTYKNHGFTIELPAGYIPHEEESEGGPYISISLPSGGLSYVKDVSWWVKYDLPSYTYVKSIKIGDTTFNVYAYSGVTFYWFRQGNVGYQFSGPKTAKIEEMLKTFKFVGWAQS